MDQINKNEDNIEEMEEDLISEVCDSKFDNKLEKNSDSKTDKSSTRDLVKNIKEQILGNFNEISRTNKNIIPENEEAVIKPTEVLPNEENLPQPKKSDYFPKTFFNKVNNYHEINQANWDIANVESEKFNGLEEASKVTLSKINKDNNIYLYREKEYFYFRKALSTEFDKKTKQEMSELLQDHFGKPVKIILHKDITDKNILQYDFIDSYILEYHILSIEKEIFLPKEKEFFQIDGVWYKNLFIPTEYLKKRFEEIQDSNTFDNFIIDFIVAIVNDFDSETMGIFTKTILNWLSYFYGKLESSNIALVLLGDKKIVDNIFWKRIVKPIFGEEFCITINDDILKKSINEIVENKIFFHIGDFTLTEDNKEKINELLEAIFIDKFVINKKTNKKIPIFAQVLITSEIALSCMEDFYSGFEFIKVENDYSTIKTKLNMTDTRKLLINIGENLDSFTDCLLIIFKKLEKRNFQLTVQNEMTKELLENKIENKIEDNFNLEEKINEFIEAIKCTNFAYFEKVKKSDNGELYKELEDSLKNEMIPREELSNYFNCVYEKEFFKDNNILLKILKEKEPLFNQCVDKKDYEKNGTSDSNHKTSILNKKQYKIKDYKLKKSYIDSKNNSSN
jgi:hypothetical protein